jgi:imidazolonepropionase
MAQTLPLVLAGRGRLFGAWPDGRDAPAVLTPWAVAIRDGRIAWVGDPTDAPGADAHAELDTALVTPGLVDAHTHPVFAGDRSDEVAARLAGAPYTGGGILRTVEATRRCPDAELEERVERRLCAALAAGTTTIECKTGYGLALDEELRHLRILGRVAGRLPIRIVRTFLGAHAIPPEFEDAAAYAAHVAEVMIPAVAAESAAEFVDVFCDAGFFGIEDTRRIGRAAGASGLGLRLHAEQLERTGAVEAGIELGAASVDHLERLDAAGVTALAGAATVATLLPGPALVMRGGLPPARSLVDAGARVALASDANAGTFGAFGTMPLVVGLGATLLGLTVEEALTAATAGGAAALRRGGGLVRAGEPADLVAWDAEHEGAFALHLGRVAPIRTWIDGIER